MFVMVISHLTWLGIYTSSFLVFGMDVPGAGWFGYAILPHEVFIGLISFCVPLYLYFTLFVLYQEGVYYSLYRSSTVLFVLTTTKSLLLTSLSDIYVIPNILSTTFSCFCWRLCHIYLKFVWIVKFILPYVRDVCLHSIGWGNPIIATLLIYVYSGYSSYFDNTTF